MSPRLNLILPAAGLGSRFREVGETRPKPLIPVFGIPMIMWVLLNFDLNKNDKVWIISQRDHQLPENLSPFVGSLEFELEFIEIDGLTEGPASTVSLALAQIPDDESVVVANTDQYVFADTGSFLRKVLSGDSCGQILTMTATSNAWSYVGRDSDGAISEVIEKVEISNEATVGVYGWHKSNDAKLSFQDTFERNIRTNNEFYVAPTYNFLISQGKLIETNLVGDHGIAVHGLGIPNDLESFHSNIIATERSSLLKSRLKI
jgi:NDP-sugar pyrophosphorylase family protein